MAHPKRVPQPCGVPGCLRVGKIVRGLCTMHYQRFVATGDPGPAESLRQRGRVCEVEGCSEPHHARGYCQTHFVRWKNTGDPGGLESRKWLGDDIAYSTVHSRAFAAAGPASGHLCDDCGKPAEEWTYQHGCPQERRNSKGSPYCPHPEHYVPRCRSCHRWFDA